MNNYEDIIEKDHNISSRHPRMSIENRAAQFAPFAALTGYSDSIKEASRITKKRLDISEDIKTFINNKLQIIKENIKLNPSITLTYFIPDKTKKGGEYLTLTTNVKKIDEYNNLIITINNVKIKIEEIIDIKINMD